MSVEWLRESVRGIVSVCMLVSLTECIAEEGKQSDGLRLICGAAVALSVVRMIASALSGII